jgi:hypothetical protein
MTNIHDKDGRIIDVYTAGENYSIVVDALNQDD